MNCFRSLYLWVDLQLVTGRLETILVVNCFRSLYLWVDLQRKRIFNVEHSVVNCFRSLYLWVDLQPDQAILFGDAGCELLSFFVPLG